MPLIPSPTPLTDGAVASADDVNEVLYRPLATPTNFEVVNGRLDSANYSGTSIKNSNVQAGAFTTAEQVGATVRNDYFYNMYESVNLPQFGGAIVTNIADLDNVSGATPENYQLRDSDHILIPGAGKQFYLPRACNVILFWHVETEAMNKEPTSTPGPTDSLAQSDSISLKLFVDGQTVSNERRQMKATDGVPSGLVVIRPQELEVYRRKWSGHCIVQLAAGWHNAGIGIAHQVYHVRTTTKRFGYVALRA